jgi:hypothetical protein
LHSRSQGSSTSKTRTSQRTLRSSATGTTPTTRSRSCTPSTRSRAPPPHPPPHTRKHGSVPRPRAASNPPRPGFTPSGPLQPPVATGRSTSGTRFGPCVCIVGMKRVFSSLLWASPCVFATVAGDSTFFGILAQDAKHRLKAFPRGDRPITAAAFNHDGALYHTHPLPKAGCPRLGGAPRTTR